MKVGLYVRQCQLSKSFPDGATHFMLAWIPTELAHAGKVLDLKQDGEWHQGWQVMTVFDTVRLVDEVREHKKADLPSIKQ